MRTKPKRKIPKKNPAANNYLARKKFNSLSKTIANIRDERLTKLENTVALLIPLSGFKKEEDYFSSDEPEKKEILHVKMKKTKEMIRIIEISGIRLSWVTRLKEVLEKYEKSFTEPVELNIPIYGTWQKIYELRDCDIPILERNIESTEQMLKVVCRWHPIVAEYYRYFDSEYLNSLEKREEYTLTKRIVNIAGQVYPSPKKVAIKKVISWLTLLGVAFLAVLVLPGLLSWGYLLIAALMSSVIAVTIIAPLIFNGLYYFLAFISPGQSGFIPKLLSTFRKKILIERFNLANEWSAVTIESCVFELGKKIEVNDRIPKNIKKCIQSIAKNAEEMYSKGSSTLFSIGRMEKAKQILKILSETVEDIEAKKITIYTEKQLLEYRWLGKQINTHRHPQLFFWKKGGVHTRSRDKLEESFFEVKELKKEAWGYEEKKIPFNPRSLFGSK